tara:strand:- start:141 stop:1253 length:1113 start_codon:yes stop_codon:yes gene_type:complete
MQEINIPAMLLMIGYLTTPTASTGVSLSEFWAWVRYLAAVTNETDLRLTSTFADLDAHQKTILSDDFGMGVPMLWLEDKLAFSRIVDGRYFMQRIAASTGATQRRAAKRGPNKTPDFVARDTSGVWHVVECKGTQSGTRYSQKQLGEDGPPPKGGIAQKRSIIFPAAHTGQRLVCGLSIGVENGEKSRLTIIDPKPEEPFEVSEAQLYLADDAVARGVVSKALRLAGFEITADATASPLGLIPSATRLRAGAQEDARLKFVEERDARARGELDRTDREIIFDGEYRGREVSFVLPRPVEVDHAQIKRVMLRQGVNRDLIGRLRHRPTFDEPNFGVEFDLGSATDKSVSKGDQRTASLQIGDIFRTELLFD